MAAAGVKMAMMATVGVGAKCAKDSPEGVQAMVERVMPNHYLHAFDKAKPCWMRGTDGLGRGTGKGD